MSDLGLPIFDRTVEVTNTWLRDIMERTGPDRQQAFHALRAVLHVLRDRITVPEAVDLGAQLPLLVRGVYYEGWVPSQVPTKQRSLDDFHDSVRSQLDRLAGGQSSLDPREATQAVFAVLKANLDRGELDDVIDQMPKPVASAFEEA